MKYGISQFKRRFFQQLEETEEGNSLPFASKMISFSRNIQPKNSVFNADAGLIHSQQSQEQKFQLYPLVVTNVNQCMLKLQTLSAPAIAKKCPLML